MFPNHIENYFAPSELSEVLQLLSSRDNAKLIAGGQSLIPLMKTRLFSPATLIDLNRVEGLDGISRQGDQLHIGALVRHQQAARDPLLRRNHEVLCEAAANVADRQVRNRGTLVGSLVFADYTSDIAPAVIASDGRLCIAGANGGTRTVNVEDFILGPFSCDLKPDEVVTTLVVPVVTGRSGGVYLKHGRVAHDRAMLGVAVSITLDEAGTCRTVRIALGGVLPRASRVPQAEAALMDRAPDALVLEAAGEAAAAAVETTSDELASAAYRSQLIRVTIPEAVAVAVQRARLAAP